MRIKTIPLHPEWSGEEGENAHGKQKLPGIPTCVTEVHRGSLLFYWLSDGAVVKTLDL